MADSAILVPATLPAMPLVLADAKFLTDLALVEKAVASLSVADITGAQEAASLLRQLTTVGNNLEKARADLKKPFLDLGRKIDEVARPVNLRIEASKGTLRKVLGDWNEREQARLAAERRKRDEELLALQRQKDAEEEAERQRVAALAVSTPAADALDFSFDEPAPKTETEKRIEQLTYAPAPVAAKPVGVGFKKTLKFSVKDVSKLPEQFVLRVANEQLIRATYCVGWKEELLPVVPGVVFFVENTAVATGRGA